MANEDPNVTVARFNYKQAIVVAAITGATTLGGTWLTLKPGEDSENDSSATSSEFADCQQENSNLKASLENSLSFTSLTDISNTHFSNGLNKEEVKGVIRQLISTSQQYEKDSQHYMHKLFRLKKHMLTNGGNINVRVSNANQEACSLIQDLLKGIEYYKGSIDGNVESTR
ncbi:MAG: hypothetical protein RLP12_15285, partial [Ekhidna sp.]